MATCHGNKIHIVEYYCSTTDTSYRNNQTLTLYSPLDNNKLFLQTGFGNNKFNIVNDNKAKVEIAINNAFIGNSENKADEIDAFLCDTNDSKWKNIKTGNDFYALKGDLIYMDLDGNGDKNYLVLQQKNNLAKVITNYYLAQTPAAEEGAELGTFPDGSTGWLYAGSPLDIYLNTTWYNTLNDIAKSAILEEKVEQGIYTYSSSSGTAIATYEFEGWEGGNYTSIKLLSRTMVGNRKVYAMSINDVIEYTGKNKVNKADITKLAFGNLYQDIILRSSPKNTQNDSWSLAISPYNTAPLLANKSASATTPARAVFTIDLSKVPFTRA